MYQKGFDLLIKSAIAGNKNAIETILEMYNPLIRANSFFQGQFNEDLRQYILIHIIKNLPKFKI